MTTSEDRLARSRPGTLRRVLLSGACACLVPAWSTVAALPAHAEAPVPSVSLSIDNGRPTVGPGDRLDYTITVTNLGADRVRNLGLSQTVPQGATLMSAGSDGDVKGRTVRWTLDLPATQQVTVRTSLRVTGPAPPDLLRLAVVACASTSSKGPPLVCATDSDQLPAGAAAEQRQAAPAPAAPPHRSWWPYAGGGLVLLGAAAGGLAVHRRRQRQAEAEVAAAQRADLTHVR